MDFHIKHTPKTDAQITTTTTTTACVPDTKTIVNTLYRGAAAARKVRG